MRSYLDSPLYQQMMAQTLRGGPQSQYPGQAIANGLAQALQAYSLKKYGEKEEAKEKAGNAEMAKALLPEQFQGAGYGPSSPIALSGGGQVDAAIPQIADVNADKRTQLAQLLNSGMVSGESLAPTVLERMGLGKKTPVKYDQTPRYDQSGKAFVLGDDGTPKYLDGISERTRVEVTNGLAYDPYTTKPGTVVDRNDPNQPFNTLTGAPNPAVQQYEKELRTLGRPSTTVNVGAERPFSQALGTGAANVLEASSAAARGGAQTLNTVSQIKQALKTGKVTAGPGTTAVQLFNQLAGGDPERLKATRATMQGLAQLTLNARGALKGQGTITDKESDLLQAAVGGTIDGLTVPEIETVINVAERAARAAIKANAENVNRARQVPGSGAVVDFFDVPEPPAPPAATPAAPRVLRYNPQTGRLE